MKHLRPAPGTLTKTDTSVTWRNRRGNSYTALWDAKYGVWEIFRVVLFECDGVIEYEPRPAIRDVDVITVEEMEALIG